MAAVELVNELARLWWNWSAAMFWQVGLLILLIAAIDRLIRRWAWPQLRYALWSLILIKLLLPPTLSLPSGIVPELRPLVGRALLLMNAHEPAGEISDAGSQISDLRFQIVDSNFGANLQLETIEIPAAGFRASVPSVANDAAPVVDLTDGAIPQSAIHIPPFTWQVYVMATWLVGTLILGVWLFLRLHSLCGRQNRSAAGASLPQSFYNRMADCANRLGLRRVPRVVVTRRLASPAVFGVFRPVLLMPRGYLSRLSRKDTEHMLLHELAHIKRGDLVAHSLYMLLQIVYWYNPLLWLARRQMHHLRELSCDATVAALLREGTLAYRQTLLETARRLLTSSVEPGLGLLGLFEDSNRLVVRLNWLTKPTWRYRTMKRFVVVTIAALMLVCVLPMARAQDAASNEQPTQVVSENVERVPSLDSTQDAPAKEDRTSQEIASLEVRLHELMVQQRQLQEQLRALAEQRAQTGGTEKTKHVSPPGTTDAYGVQPYAEQTPHERDATIVLHRDRRATEEELRLLREARRQAEQARQEQSRVRTEMDRVQQEAKKVQAEAMRQQEWATQRQQWANSEQMQQWRADVEKWQNSEQMNRWKQEVERWAQNLARRYGQGATDSTDAVPNDAAAAAPAPMPEMPPMPPMPAMPPMHSPSVGVHVAPVPHAESSPGVSATPAPAPRPESHPRVVVPHIGTPAPVLPALPKVPVVPEEPGHVISCGDFVVKSLRAGTVLLVENNVGSITIEGTEEPDCTVAATARIKGVEREEAERIAKDILIQVTPDEGRVCVRTQLPETLDEEQRNRIAIHLRIAVPNEVKVQAVQNVGNVSLSSLLGNVQATAEVGAIHAWDLQGDVALRTNVGNIRFATSKDLSAKIRAQAKVGSISGNLPLEITGAAVMQAGNAQNALGSHATGTLGQGRHKIELTASVGAIQVLWESSPPEHEVF